ncbi:MAG TPA: hypothetical protein VFU13_11385 [Steroidobacteraceae bacterium]|nr:hypothetical protein [Steroidobacteraceae bacterium]
MSPLELQPWVSFLLGATFVALYSAIRLRGPEADRSYTTCYRYCIACVYYAFGHLAVYLLAVCAIWATYQLGLVSFVDYLLTTPAWVALLTAVLLPRLKPFSTIDAVFRAHARQIGGMPDEAVVLRDAICSARRVLGDAEIREVHFGLLRRGLDLGQQRKLPDDTLHAQFQQAAELKFLLDKCAQQRQFAGFARDNARALQLMSRRFDHLMFRSSRSSEAIGRLHDFANSVSGKSGNWESLGALAETEAFASESTTVALDPATTTSRMLINSLREDMRYFCNDAALLLSRLTLRSRRTESGRVRLLRGIGVYVAPVARPNFRPLAAVFLAVFAIMCVAAAVRTGTDVGNPIRPSMIMIPIYFVVAVLCAVYPKQYFCFANVDVYGRKPYLFFVCAGFTAATLAFVIGLVVRIFRLHDGGEALRAAILSSPRLLTTFTLAFVMAILVQDTRGAKNSQQDAIRSWRDAFVLAVALGASTLVAQVLLTFTRPGYELQFTLVWFTTAIGAFIGYYVPKRFRNIYCMAPGEEQKPPALTEALTASAIRLMKGATR